MRGLSITGRKVMSQGGDVQAEAAQLRARLAELERGPADQEREERERYLGALHVERDMVASQLAAASSYPPDEHEVCITDPQAPPTAVARLSWGERADVLERRLAAVERELERIT